MTFLVVDDHAIFRSRARRVLEAAGYRVIGEASDGAGALAEVDRLRPDAVLLDIQLPDIDGFDVLARLAERESSPRVVLTSSREAADFGSRLSDAPAAGFIHKPELSRAAVERLVGGAR